MNKNILFLHSAWARIRVECGVAVCKDCKDCKEQGLLRYSLHVGTAQDTQRYKVFSNYSTPLHTAIPQPIMPGDDQPATKDDIRAILADSSQVFDQKLSNTKEEVLALQLKTTSLLTQKLKDSTKAKWRREGNHRQFEFNQQVSG